MTFDTISGGICIYLLIAVSWALAMAVLETAVPGSFVSGGDTLMRPAGPIRESSVWFGQFVYLSFTTITTLGFGDITPATPLARMLTTTEAVVGQLYVTIFIAALVALYLRPDPAT